MRAEFDALMSGKALDALRTRRDAGLKAFGGGHYRAAVDHLSAAVRLGAADGATRTALGVAYMRLGEVDDDGTALLSYEIARQIEDQLEYPGQVKVIVIRESRAVEVAK